MGGGYRGTRRGRGAGHRFHRPSDRQCAAHQGSRRGRRTVNPTRQQISDATSRLGWRLILGAIYAQVRVPTLTAATEVAALAAAACADAPGHLHLDLRTDRAVLRLQSETIGAVTEQDLELAQRLAWVLQEAGNEIEPGGAELQTFEIAIDALDIASVRPFWKAVTGYVDVHGVTDLHRGLCDPAGRGPVIWFQQMDRPRAQRNRIHIDVDVTHDMAAGRIRAALAAGGVLLSDRAAPAFWVLADAEGNEACLCTWQGRD
ncbi:VOC family protein [Mycobacterium sp. C31M]